MEFDEDNFYSRTVNNCQKLMEKYAHKYINNVDVSEKARRPKLPSHEVERRCLCAIAHLKDNLDSTYMDVANRYGISDTSLREMSKEGDLIGITRAYRILKNLIASGKVEVQHFYAETSVGGKFKKSFYKLVTSTQPEVSQS